MKLLTTFLFTCTIMLAQVLDFNTISSDFKQTITNEENSKIVYEGSFYASTQAKALWIYKKPIEKKIYFNKNQVIIIEPELEQVIITNIENSPNLTEILKGATKKDDNTYEASYENIKYNIKVQNDKILQISYKDTLANSVKIELFNQTMNSFLDDALFKATVPKDFDVIMQ
ncbi:LolA-like outer membrane lipoprotein chaperone [Sulfurospirillum arcachonense]|uniref:LolA-like outer membrane lipoprotein chaperone n=1 Tax=Sulfurospirillum arcachonense TaxID=57666 RepID=UPI00046A5726|nr:LolA-like outer membrane lipoprotein chaperone [Sulfurospirillum arcachonense]